MADHTGERARVDTSSIKTTTLFSFVMFALFLLIVMWGLSNFFINTYYEKAADSCMKNQFFPQKTFVLEFGSR